MTAAATVWESGRLDARVGPRQVLFGRMYEDTDIELAAFPAGGRIMCVASAGCTAIKLAPHHDVVAIDINPVQLDYAKRRVAGDPGCRGRAERIMDFGRFFAPLAGWWPSVVSAFVELEQPAEQMAFWQQHLDGWRFRTALDAMFSLTALRSVYSSPLLDCLPRRLGQVMRGRLARCFARHPNRTNPYARALLLGELSSETLPRHANSIEFVHADAASFLEGQPAQSFDGFTLSNILDGVDEGYRTRLMAAIARAARPGAACVLRSFSNANAHAPNDCAADDRSMLWGSVLVQRL